MALKSNDLVSLIKASATKAYPGDLEPDRLDPGDLVLVRVDDRDYPVKQVRKGYDGVLGNYVVLETQPITDII